MKKKLLFILLALVSIPSVYALNKTFNINTSEFNLSLSKKDDSVISLLSSEYSITSDVTNTNEEVKEEITNLSKKVTYLLFGDSNKDDESSEEYYERRHDFLDLRYNPIVPKSDEYRSGLDETSKEYQDDILSGISLPGMFNTIDKLNIRYNTIDKIRVNVSDDVIISVVSLPQVNMKEEDKNNPMNYVNTKTNLIMYYYFKKLDGNYKLYYLFGETTDELNEYFSEVEDSESSKALSIKRKYDTELNNVYDFSKLSILTNTKLNEIYDNNKNNLVMINSYYNTSINSVANGILINDGLVLTTWSFLNKALLNSQGITIRNSDGNTLAVDGVVTINPTSDVAIIKLKDKVNSSINIGDSSNLKVEDALAIVSSKSGVGFSILSGIVTSIDSYIETSIPLEESDQGSALFDSNGLLVGMNTSKSVDTSVSMAINSNVLKSINDKFSNIDFNSIKVVSFNELKEKYYTNKVDESVINNIPSNIWNEYKVIGDIENTISLELVKASYDKNVVSLRYKNGVSSLINSMNLSASFTEKLINSGYTNILNTSNKAVYKNDKYKVVLIEEFDYLVVVMVKL